MINGGLEKFEGFGILLAQQIIIVLAIWTEMAKKLLSASALDIIPIYFTHYLMYTVT